MEYNCILTNIGHEKSTLLVDKITSIKRHNFWTQDINYSVDRTWFSVKSKHIFVTNLIWLIVCEGMKDENTNQPWWYKV